MPFIFWCRSLAVVLCHHWTIRNLQLDIVVHGNFCNHFLHSTICEVLHFFLFSRFFIHSFYFSVFSVYTYKNHFFHHLTKWTETFATRHSGISLSTNYLQYSEEQFNLRHLRKPQLSLHLVVVALSPVEQRQSLCTKDLMLLFFSRPCINSLAESFLS